MILLMMHVPNHLLEKLKCSICDGYLSSSPVVVVTERQICGKCYKILPKDEQKSCARQQSFELLAESVTFPCRFRYNGCNHEYPWNGENGHEKECHYRFPQYYQIPKDNTTSHVLKSESDDIKADFKYELRENQRYTSLTYTLGIRGNYGKILSIQGPFNEQSNVYLTLEGALILKSSPEVIYNDIKVRPVEEHHYESIQDYVKRCLYCRKTNENVFECKLGHTACYNCKKSSCFLCIDQTDQSMARCKNFERGCNEKFVPTSKSFHEKSCEYNAVACPVEKCKFSDILKNIRLHLDQAHEENTVINNELSKNFSKSDESLVFICYDNIFKCTYYEYESYLEFFILFVGQVDLARKFSYEISVEGKKKRGKCCTCYDAMLTKGVVFDKSEIDVDYESEFSVKFDIVIIQT